MQRWRRIWKKSETSKFQSTNFLFQIHKFESSRQGTPNLPSMKTSLLRSIPRFCHTEGTHMKQILLVTLSDLECYFDKAKLLLEFLIWSHLQKALRQFLRLLNAGKNEYFFRIIGLPVLWLTLLVIYCH